jgi:hypothetical protein
MYNMELEFDTTTGAYYSPEGVNVAEIDYGGVNVDISIDS